MSYQVLLDQQVREFMESLDEKSRRICRENLLALEDDPYPRPGAGRGDREKLVYKGEEVYRLHISRHYTAIYDIFEDRDAVEVYELLPIDEAHKNYGH